MLNCSGELSEFFGKKIISGSFCVFSGLFLVFARHIACYALLSEIEKHSQTQLSKKDCAKLKQVLNDFVEVFRREYRKRREYL